MLVRLPILKDNSFAKMSVSDNYYIKKTPFVNVVDSSGIAKLFLEAVLKKDFDDARSYISKKFIDLVDLEELESILSEKKICDYMQKIEFEKDNNNFETTSLILLEDGKSIVMHLYLIQEINYAGKWKIFGFEQE